MNARSAVDTINRLLQILEDGKEEFREAARTVRDQHLQGIFSAYVVERAQMIGELLMFTSSAPQPKKPTIAGAAHRGRSDSTGPQASGDDEAILLECKRSEDRVVEAFKDALTTDLPVDLCETIKSQSVRILESHRKVRELRDAAHLG